MKKKTKFLATLTVLALVVALGVVMAVSVFAAETTSDGFVYEVNEDGTTVTITDYVGSATEITIPSEIGGKTVTAIGELAFSTGDAYDTTTTKITIPDTVLEIGCQAFMNKRALKEIIIPDSVLFIDDEAFFKCNAATKLSIGKGVEYIGICAFGRLSALTDLTVDPENAFFKVENDCLVDIVYDMVLVGEQVETVVIPDGITSIDDFAFYGPGTAKGNIKKIVVSSGVKYIGESAFDCTAVNVLVLPKSVKYIGGALVANTALKPANNGGIPGNVYYEGSEEEWNGIEINSYANAVIKTGATRHYNCCMADLVTYTHKYTNDTCDNICNNCDKVTRTVASEHNYVNKVCTDCGAEPLDKYVYDYEVNLDGTITILKYLGNDTVIDIPSTIEGKTVTIIGDDAFSTGEVYDTTTTKITIPNTVQVIGNRAFYNKRAITEVTLPESVVIVGEDAFFKCINVKKLSINSNLMLAGSRAFARLHALEEIKIADGNEYFEYVGGCLVDTYRSAVITTINTDDIIIPDGIVEIADCAFYLRNQLTTIVIPDGVEYIGENAFDGSSISVVVIPKSVTTIVNAAFANTANLANSTGHVYYEGSAEDYANIDWLLSYVGTTQNNNIIRDDRSTKHFNSCMAADDYIHAYSGDCDSICDECEKTTREADSEHTYDNSCDDSCNACGDVRVITHSFSTSWSTDASGHWHECTVCRVAKADEGAHTGGAADCKTKKVCSTCNASYGELGECNYVEVEDAKYLKTEANCMDKAVYYKSCSVCGTAHASETFEGSVNADKHVGGAYEKNNDEHWKKCACGEDLEKAAHTFGDWTVTEEAGESKTGKKEKTCSVCGFKVTEVIPATEGGNKAPQTGYKGNIILLTAILGVTVAVFGAVMVSMKKTKIQ